MAAASAFRVLAWAALLSLAARGNEDVLRQVDSYRYPWPSFSMEVSLRDGKLDQRWRVLVRENGDARVEGLSEKEKGRAVLLLEDQMWLLLPNTKRPVKVSPQQRLMGPAAGGDIARFRFSTDYDLASERNEAIEGKPARRLDLQAAHKRVSYRTAVLWITPEGLPLRSDFFFASGKLARTAYFGPLASERGAQVLSSLRLEEPSGKRVELIFTHWKPTPVNNHLFELPKPEPPKPKD